MRASPLLRSSLLLLPALTACSSTVIGGGGVGGAGGAPPADLTSSSSSSGWISTASSVASSSSSGFSTTSSSGFSGCADPTPVGLPAAPCTPTSPTCGASSSVCLATAHAHAAPTFGLRMAHITMTAPAPFTQGIVKSVFEGNTAPSSPACNLSGAATFNWLLRFDTNAGTLVTGAAKPVADPSLGYTFLQGPVQLGGQTFTVAPLTLSAPLDSMCGITSTAGDVLLPFYGDSQGNTFTILPLRALRFFDTQITPDHDCIGAYNAAGLSPANSCLSDGFTPQFLDGGHFDAFMSLEQADTVLVSPLNQTLCVLLAGNPQIYADGGNPQKCKRDASNAIVFKGDWCAATNQPANGGCADAVRFAGSFAASGTKID